MAGKKLIRIGMVNYINTAPIYEVWKRRKHPDNWKVVEAPPSTLNTMLASDALDLGFVSSYEYAQRPTRYQIIPDLSISASGPVGSVFLFSKSRPELLNAKKIVLSGQSETSIALVKIILENHYHVHPEYMVGDVSGPQALDVEAVLAIGDDALRLAAGDAFYYQLDLGKAWGEYTGLPFVFAVCAARAQFCKENREEVTAIQKEFFKCREIGNEKLESICVDVAPRIPMHPDECYVYLRAIEYDLGEKKQLALETFYKYLIERGEASALSVPLHFF